MPATQIDQRLILLPGLGVDQRLFIPQQELFPRLEIPAWIPHRDGESLVDYAVRLAGTIKFESDEPYFLGGASFGGMLAQEVARVLPRKPAAVILIASCRSGRQLAGHIPYVEWVSRWIPDYLIRAKEPLLAVMVPDLWRLSPGRRAIFLSMIREAPLDFVRWGSRAILEWNPSAPLDVPLRHIHGADDPMIPVAGIKPDRIVPGVGHLLNMNRPDVVNAYLLEVMAEFAPK